MRSWPRRSRPTDCCRTCREPRRTPCSRTSTNCQSVAVENTPAGAARVGFAKVAEEVSSRSAGVAERPRMVGAGRRPGDPAAAYGLTLPDLPDELEQMCERPRHLSVALLSGTDAPVRPHTTLDGATDNSPRPNADGTRSTARRSACRRRRRRRAARCRAGRNRSPTVCGTWSGCHSGAAGRRWLHSRRMHTETPPAPRRCPGTSPTSRWERDSSDDRYP